MKNLTDQNTLAFSNRLSVLREQRGISAREMSLSLGQAAGYINNIENGKNLPSMAMFFEICGYLRVTPREFFDYPEGKAGREEILTTIRQLTPEDLEILIRLARRMQR